MGFRSDFNTIHFHETFNQSNQASQVKTFRVEHSGAGSVVDDAYLLIQATGVDNNNHRILINGSELPDSDIPAASNDDWRTWMEHVPEGRLHAGDNTIQIVRTGDDSFRVGTVVVNWREGAE